MIQRRSMRTIAALAIATLALTAAGCSGPSGDDNTSNGSEDVQDTPKETVALTLGYFPLAHTATAVYAEQAGLFSEENLDVTLTPTAGGASAITGLSSGSLDITYSNYTSAILAAKKGLNIKLIAGNDVGEHDHGIFVTSDSGIKDWADLKGKTIAVNNLQNIGTVAVYAQLKAIGIAPSEVNIVEMGYPDMPAALDRKAIDAAWQVEPFQAAAVSAGLTKIGDLFSGPVADMPVAGWVTTGEWADKNPAAVKAFARAMLKATEYLQANPDALRQLVPTFTKISAEVVSTMDLPLFDGELNMQQLQKTADLMLEYKIIDQPMEVKTMLAVEAK